MLSADTAAYKCVNEINTLCEAMSYTKLNFGSLSELVWIVTNSGKCRKNLENPQSVYSTV